MEPIIRYSLEDFAERHRADFDLHEPRPELWSALQTKLDATATGKAGASRMSLAADEPVVAASLPVTAVPAPVLRAQRRRWQPVGLALLVLVVATGLVGTWRAHRATPFASRPADAASQTTVADAALYLGRDTGVMAASDGGPNGNARLDTAVHGMERYYATQLADRQAQLSQLAPDTQAEWAQQLIGLDSSYQQLKRQLPLHPQPEVVLTAMNRNLQIRLDILDQQLALHGASQLAQSSSGISSEYALADSRSVAENVSQHHVR